MPDIKIQQETFPIQGSFRIARGAKTEIHVVTVTLEDDGKQGRGECVPYARYGETVESVVETISSFAEDIKKGLSRSGLHQILKPGAARNAIDCALWDLEAKKQGRSVANLAGLGPLHAVTTAYTLSLDTPENMQQAAQKASDRPLLKVKLGGDGDEERMRAVRAGAPKARLIIDANEGWHEDNLPSLMKLAHDLNIELIEQPLPAGKDEILGEIAHPVPICADESAHDRENLENLIGLYDAINIKLDKTGGLTEALALSSAARHAGLDIMVGCMLGTSLAMAPAILVAQKASIVDLDGPLLLAKDRTPGLTYKGSQLQPASPELWG